MFSAYFFAIKPNDLYSEREGHCLKKLILPESLVRIGNNVFCASITDIECKSFSFVAEDGFLLSADKNTLYRYFGTDVIVNIPPSVIFIKSGAFSGIQIKQINIPKSVKHIGDNPFASCQELRRIICNSKNFQVLNDTLYDLQEKRLIACWNNKTTRFFIKFC